MTAAVSMDRGVALARLRDEVFDVVVIGGGITGAGVALDAVTRGFRTAIVERNDWAAGTSSKSSKMVHGGLRYLQQKEFRLVYENLHERQRLLRNAPHLVSVLPFLIPMFGKPGLVSKTIARGYRTALWLYDITGGWRIGKRHVQLDAATTLAHMPGLDPARVAGGFLYYDAQADDARLTLSVVRTAAVNGAAACNHIVVRALHKGPDGKVAGVVLDDGTVVRGRCVVNATGVWAESVQQLDGAVSHAIRPAKGVHIVVPAAKLPLDVGAVLPVRADRRSVFVVPGREVEGAASEVVYIGTTDTDYDGDPDRPSCTADDVRYLLDAVNAWSAHPLTEADVLGVWAGLRPLLTGASGGDLAPRTADLSRRHAVVRSASGLVSILGGKLTTYRRMAEDTVDEVTRALGTKTHCRTRRLRLVGALEAGAANASAPLPHLLARYGTEAVGLRSLIQADPTLGEPLVDGLPYLRAEAVWAVRQEQAVTLSDVLVRRARCALYDLRATMAAAPAVAALLAPLLGWDESETRRQVEAFLVDVTTEAPTIEAPTQGGRPSPA